jgi:dephospho-CoA kinase
MSSYYIITIYCNDELRKERALGRANLDVRKFENILNKQLPDKKKKLLSHFILNSEENKEMLAQKVKAIINKIKWKKI